MAAPPLLNQQQNDQAPPDFDDQLPSLIDHIKNNRLEDVKKLLTDLPTKDDLCRRLFEHTDRNRRSLLAQVCIGENASIDIVKFLIDTLANLAPTAASSDGDDALKKHLQLPAQDGSTLPMLIGRYCKDPEIVKCIVQTMIVQLGYKSFVEILQEKKPSTNGEKVLGFLRDVSKNEKSKDVVRLMAGLLVEVGLFKEQYNTHSDASATKAALKKNGGIDDEFWKPAREDCLVSPLELLLKAMPESVDSGTLDDSSNIKIKDLLHNANLLSVHFSKQEVLGLTFMSMEVETAEIAKLLLTKSYHIGGLKMLKWQIEKCHWNRRRALRPLIDSLYSTDRASVFQQLVSTVKELTGSADLCRHSFELTDKKGDSLLAQVCVHNRASIAIVKYLIDTLADLAPNDATLKEQLQHTDEYGSTLPMLIGRYCKDPEIVKVIVATMMEKLDDTTFKKHLQLPAKDGSTLPMLIGRYCKDPEIVKCIVQTMIDKLGYDSFIKILQEKKPSTNGEKVLGFLRDVSKNEKSKDVVRLMAGLLVEVGLFKEQYNTHSDASATKAALKKNGGIDDEFWKPAREDLFDERDLPSWHETLSEIRAQRKARDMRIRTLRSAIFNNSDVSGVEALRTALPLERLSAIDLCFLSHANTTENCITPFPLTPENSSLAMKECLVPTFIDIACEFWCSFAYTQKQGILDSCARDVPIGQRGDRDITRNWYGETVRHCHPVLRMKSDDIFTVLYFNFGGTDYSRCTAAKAAHNSDYPCEVLQDELPGRAKLRSHFHGLIQDYMPDAIVICEFTSSFIDAPTFKGYEHFKTPDNTSNSNFADVVVLVRSDLVSQEVKTSQNDTHDRFIIVDITKTVKDKQSGAIKSEKKLRLSGVHGQKKFPKGEGPQKDHYPDLRDQYFVAPNFLAIGDWNGYSHGRLSNGFAREITRQGDSMFVRGEALDNFLVKRVPNQFKVLLGVPPVPTTFDYAISREPHLEKGDHPVIAVAMQW